MLFAVEGQTGYSGAVFNLAGSLEYLKKAFYRKRLIKTLCVQHLYELRYSDNNQTVNEVNDCLQTRPPLAKMIRMR